VTATERALSLLHGLTIDEHGTTWGETATDWQRDDARAVLDVDTPGAPRRHLLTRPRGGRKTADAAGYLVSAMLCQAPAGAECYSFSVDKDNAAMVLRSMRELVVFSGLGGAVHMTESRAIQRVRFTEDGRTVPVDTALAAQYTPQAADSASANGLRPWLSVVDELSHWRDGREQRALMETLVSLLEKGDDRRLVAIMNAGAPEHFAHWWRKRAQDSRFWRINEVPGPLPYLTAEQLEALAGDIRMPWKRARLIDNVWTSGGSKLTAGADVEECLRETSQPLGPRPGNSYAIGVDLGHRRDLSVAAICHTEVGEERWVQGRRQVAGRRVVVDDLMVWKPRILIDGTRQHVQLADVEDWVLSAARTYRARVYLDLSQAASMEQSLIRQGVFAEAKQPTVSFNSKVAVTLYRLLADRAMSLPNDEDLADELRSIVLVETSPGIYKLDMDSNADDDLGHHDRVSAIGHAVHALLEGPQAVDFKPTPKVWFFDRVTQTYVDSPAKVSNYRGGPGFDRRASELRQKLRGVGVQVPEPAATGRGTRAWR
jgi:hypothetical protein